MSAAGEGWTEPNIYFRHRRKCKRVPGEPLYYATKPMYKDRLYTSRPLFASHRCSIGDTLDTLVTQFQQSIVMVWRKWASFGVRG